MIGLGCVRVGLQLREERYFVMTDNLEDVLRDELVKLGIDPDVDPSTLPVENYEPPNPGLVSEGDGEIVSAGDGDGTSVIRGVNIKGGEILYNLKMKGARTIRQLMEDHKMSRSNVRYYLSALEEQGSVRRLPVKRGKSELWALTDGRIEMEVTSSGEIVLQVTTTGTVMGEKHMFAMGKRHDAKFVAKGLKDSINEPTELHSMDINYIYDLIKIEFPLLIQAFMAQVIVDRRRSNGEPLDAYWDGDLLHYRLVRTKKHLEAALKLLENLEPITSNLKVGHKNFSMTNALAAWVEVPIGQLDFFAEHLIKVEQKAIQEQWREKAKEYFKRS